ncbi:MAG: RNA 3'-terminal phosphate cyclase [Syntrophobacterales bacterium]
MSERDYTVIDGSYGEGGGQILRTSLSLSAITGRPLKLVNIRGKRKKPGLRPQHLTGVQACAAVSDAKVVGDKLGKQELTFRPEEISGGSYTFRIPTAGAATLVLQAILPALWKAKGESSLVVVGGTHVPWSPPFHYLAEVFAPLLDRLGFRSEIQISRWGWYPKGGGEIKTSLRSCKPSGSIILDRPFELQRLTGISASSQLPEHIRVRQKRQLLRRFEKAGIEAEIGLMDVPALNPGSLVFVCAQGKGSLAGFSSLGARGKSAERVADEAANALFQFLDSEAALDHYLADQILIYLAIATGEHRFTTSKITQHLLTNTWVIEQFLPVYFEVEGRVGEAGLVIKRDAG